MTDGIIFTKQDGTFKQEGECLGTHGLFQWKRQDGLWDGGWTIEPRAVVSISDARSSSAAWATRC